MDTCKGITSPYNERISRLSFSCSCFSFFNLRREPFDLSVLMALYVFIVMVTKYVINASDGRCQLFDLQLVFNDEIPN